MQVSNGMIVERNITKVTNKFCLAATRGDRIVVSSFRTLRSGRNNRLSNPVNSKWFLATCLRVPLTFFKGKDHLKLLSWVSHFILLFAFVELREIDCSSDH